MQRVIGAFENREAAQRAVEKLAAAGIDRQAIHVEQPDTTYEGKSGMASGGSPGAVDEDRGVMSSIGHFFASVFGEDNDRPQDVHNYAEAVRRGNSIVVVDARDDAQAEQAAECLHQCDAIDVDERAQQWRAEGWDGGRNNVMAGAQTQADLRPVGKQTERTAGAKPLGEGREGVLDVVQEELRIGKRSVERGGVRVVQRVSEKPVHELVRLREERAVVERRPVNREASADELANFREGTIEVRETAEEPVVQKTARVVEEVRVGKDVREREAAIDDRVRRKDVDVERMAGTERERAVASDRTAESAAERERRESDVRSGDVTGKPRRNP